MKLEGRAAIVTGAGRGLGRAITLCLVEEGADVAICSFQKETADRAASEVEALGRRALAIPGDITRRGNIAKAVQKTLDTFGKIDILVNNVGGAGRTPEDVGDDPLAKVEAEWDGMYEQNIRAAVLMSYAVAPHFIKQRSGKIVNMNGNGLVR